MRSSYRDAGRLWFTHRVLCTSPAPEPPGYDHPHRATKNHSAANEPNTKHLQSDMHSGSQRFLRWESLALLGAELNSPVLNCTQPEILGIKSSKELPAIAFKVRFYLLRLPKSGN